jgi:multicomponent Na+:H+ antiporter subunit D
MAQTNLQTAMIDTATSAADWVIVLPIVLFLMGAALSLVLRKRGTLVFGIAVAVLLAVIACEVSLLLRVYQDGPLSMTMGNWLPPFGIALAADAFGASFALAASVAGLIVLLYAQGERGRVADDGFHALLLLLMAGVTGSFLTGDLFNLYVWFEVMLISSFGLIVLGGRPVQLDAAVKYGFLNFLATTFFLLSLGLIYGMLGTLNMADILRVAPSANPAAMAGVAALLLLAFGMKAAAFPVNAWLPAAYHAPPAAISAIFAGLLTKVGVYALLRSLVVILPASRDLLEPVLVFVALGTLVLSPLGAIAETNLRRAIGFFVIGGVGAVMVGIALPSLEGVTGAGLYIVHAMLTITALYLVVGQIENYTGETDTRRMGGIYGSSSILSIAFFVLVLASAGVPPFLGFWPKLALLQAGFAQGNWAGNALAIALLVNAVLTLIAGTRIWAHVFWRPVPDELEGSAARKITPKTSFAAVAALVVLVLAMGLWPNALFAVVGSGASDIVDPQRYVDAIGLAGAPV